MAMKMRNYIKVSYKMTGRKNEKLCNQEFTMSESRLINYVIKELAIDGKCEVELIECTQDEYDLKF